MSNIGRLWAGYIYGTNTGNVFAELEQAENRVAGLLRVMDREFGIAVYRVQGAFEKGKLELDGVPEGTIEGIESGNIRVAGTLTPEGQIRGQWNSTLGTGGTFLLFPHDQQISTE